MKINTEINISCGPKEVFPWIDNPDKAMLWQKDVKSGEIIKVTPEKIGTTFKEEIEENGKSLIMYGEITDYVPDKLISFKLESRIHRVHVSYSVTGYSNKSKVTVSSTIKWKFPMNIMSLILGGKMKKSIMQQTRSELSELKKLCEK